MTVQKLKKLNKGFTLIELLVVIGILAILLAITLIAINPARQFAQSNDTKRKSDVSAILNAIGQYSATNTGTLPGDNANPALNEITTTVQPISDTGADICTALVTAYIAQLPSDPTTGSPTGAIPASCAAPYNTGYTVVKSALDNRVTVAGVGQLTPVITATR
ncbi:MAG TPA: type II secretion system protein [Candidatus Limnocylindrales bacterium]|nr:type II secretion system protein [Candidatus Limnocylindrales bacterium]